MIKCEVIKSFTLGQIEKVKIINQKAKGNLFNTGDIIECDTDMLEYLTKTNARSDCFVKVIEIIPEIKKSTRKKK